MREHFPLDPKYRNLNHGMSRGSFFYCPSPPIYHLVNVDITFNAFIPRPPLISQTLFYNISPTY